MSKLSIRKKIVDQTPISYVDFVAGQCDLSKMIIKKTMTVGGAWHKPKGRRTLLRVRKAKTMLKPGDYIEFHYDDSINHEEEHPEMVELFKENGYAIWYKPSGVMTQGTQYGDKGSLFRHIEVKKSKLFLINRLDRNTAGLVCIAYDPKRARTLTNMWINRKVRKHYRAIVKGHTPSFGVIETPLEGKEAITSYSVITREGENSKVEVEIETGRLHQIRKHFESIGHPVMGDHKYGKGNKNKDGLKLVAYQLEFLFKDESKVFTLPDHLLPF